MQIESAYIGGVWYTGEWDGCIVGNSAWVRWLPILEVCSPSGVVLEEVLKERLRDFHIMPVRASWVPLEM